MKPVVILFFLFICNQAIASTLDDALQAALKTAEVDHKSKQVLLEVEPEQVEKATHMKNSHEQIVVKIEDNIFDDLASTPAMEVVDLERKPTSSTSENSDEMKSGDLTVQDLLKAEMLEQPTEKPVTGPVAQITKDVGDI